jgi:hypothetical protein
VPSTNSASVLSRRRLIDFFQVFQWIRRGYKIEDMRFRLRSIVRVHSLINDDSCGFYGSVTIAYNEDLITNAPNIKIFDEISRFKFSTEFHNLFQRDAVCDDIHRLEMIARLLNHVDPLTDLWKEKLKFFRLMTTETSSPVSNILGDIRAS